MHRQRLILTAVLALIATGAQAATTVENIRIWADNGKTRVVLDLSRPAQHNIFTLRGPDRLVVDLKDGRLANTLRDLPEGVGSVRRIRTGAVATALLGPALESSVTVSKIRISSP